ncbi:MAG TPA: methyltransferase domain-containing protein [Polyangiaceae bacterium]|jgi:SAM-dependent methyltransferase|nr:methyltransferase domain-containing protein [Polyangiaceae bacterium]
MDLSEVRSSTVRHPWETARAAAIERIIREAKVSPHAILDYGCGDGFTGERMLRAFGASSLVGFDIHLTDEQCGARSNGTIAYANDWTRTGTRSFDLCLLCDVIEHVADDRALLELVRKRLCDNGQALITVPAFQALFSNHDRALKHFRRYALGQLQSVIASAGFELVSSGYMFASLLAGRGLAMLAEAIKPKESGDQFGIGAWTGSPRLTQAVEAVLNLDNSTLFGLAKRGIRLPGLSAWALCKKRPS